MAEKLTRRGKLIRRIRSRLAKSGSPRLVMTMILAVSGAFGFLGSVIMLRWGVASMALRYPIAVVAGYAAFLAQLRLWAAVRSGQIDLWSWLPDLSLPRGSGSSGGGRGFLGGGGRFGGGGASAPTDPPASLPIASEASAVDGAAGALDGIDVDLDDAWPLVLVIALLLGAVIAVVFVVWSAPVLLAEVFVDVAVVGGVYRGVRDAERSHWAVSALRRTALPASAIAVLLGLLGLVLSAADPNAHSLGPAFAALIAD